MQRATKELELRSILRSGIVREGTQLYSLLEYLGNLAIEDAGGTLKEYRIGVEALGKPPDYDPRIDPTVRVEVAKLRKKLEEFYHTSGGGHPARMVIPKGSYAAVFEPPPAGAGRVARRWQAPARWILISLLVVAAVVPWLVRRKSSPDLAPELRAFWGSHFADDRPTLLVYGAPIFLKMQGKYFRNPNVNQPEGFGTDGTTQKILGLLKPREARPVFTFTGTGEAEALFHLTRVLAVGGATLIAEPSNTVGWEDMKGKHVVFLGGRKYNGQLPDLPVKPKFVVLSRNIVNLEPLPGEPGEYRTASVTPHGEITEEYALVSVYPGFGEHTRLVALECSSTEGTLAAAEFVTRPDMVAQLISRGVPVEWKSGHGRAFQVVIRAKLNRGVVVELSYRNHRTLS